MFYQAKKNLERLRDSQTDEKFYLMVQNAIDDLVNDEAEVNAKVVRLKARVERERRLTKPNWYHPILNAKYKNQKELLGH